MKKTVIAILVVAGIVVFGSMGAGIWLLMKYAPHGGMYHSNQPVSVTVPKQKSTNTLAIFNFKGNGDSDAKCYAIGFARALADRLYCAPTCVTQQFMPTEISSTLCRRLGNPAAIVDLPKAASLGRSMGVRYVVTGELKLSGNNVRIVMRACDTYKPSSKSEITLTGVLSDMGGLQRQAVDKLISVMSLKPTNDQMAELHKPNFSNTRILKLYAKSFKERDTAKVEALRWQIVDMDPGSSFAVQRLLEYYYFGPSRTPQIKSNARLQKLLTELDVKFPGNTAIKRWHAVMLEKQYEYELAERELLQLAQYDRHMAYIHTELAYLARCRQNGKMAVDEGRKVLSLWPDNPYFHAVLANDYYIAANNARHGHYMGAMNWQMKSDWERDMYDSLREAMIAVKMDHGCDLGWYKIMQAGLYLSRGSERDQAYQKYIKLNPKDPEVYIAYGCGYLPQWGGSLGELNSFFSETDRALGTGSPDACYVRSSLLMYQINGGDRKEELRLVDAGLSASKEPHYGCMINKCRLLAYTKKYDESLKVAEDGYKQWGSLDWLYQVAASHADIYYYHHKMEDLRQARALYAKYVQEIPYDPDGHVQLGWCMSHLGYPAEAKKEFLRALELDPANETAKEKLKYVE